MGMDPETGFIRALDSVDDLKENEVLFQLGEKVELKNCRFKIAEVWPDLNQITLKGIPKKKEASSESPAAEARA